MSAENTLHDRFYFGYQQEYQFRTRPVSLRSKTSETSFSAVPKPTLQVTYWILKLQQFGGSRSCAHFWTVLAFFVQTFIAKFLFCLILQDLQSNSFFSDRFDRNASEIPEIILGIFKMIYGALHFQNSQIWRTRIGGWPKKIKNLALFTRSKMAVPGGIAK